jgi:hypothetical protein
MWRNNLPDTADANANIAHSDSDARSPNTHASDPANTNSNSNSNSNSNFPYAASGRNLQPSASWFVSDWVWRKLGFHTGWWLAGPRRWNRRRGYWAARSPSARCTGRRWRMRRRGLWFVGETN